jgi:hypothetical protein
MLPTADALITAFDGAAPAASDSAFLRTAHLLHEANAEIWRLEDLARRRLAPDAEIVANKRDIDRTNQRRSDLVEKLDDEAFALLCDRMAHAPRMNSETPGQIVDRLSILSLKIRAMNAQAARADAGAAHRESCAQRLHSLREQRSDLASCLDALLGDCAQGRARFKVYRGHKMYNDPSLNPAMYAERLR